MCAYNIKTINIKREIEYVEPATSTAKAATAASPVVLHDIGAAVLVLLLLSPLLRNHGSVFSF